MVSADAIERRSETEGVALTDGVQIWVGTELGPVAKPLWQIKLRAGESVEILGELNYPAPEGFSTTWLQIAPPAGEFRWVALSDLILPQEIAEQLTGSSEPRVLPIPKNSDGGNVRTVQETMELDDPFGDRGSTELLESDSRDDFDFGRERRGASESLRTAAGSSSGWRKATRPFPTGAHLSPGPSGFGGIATENSAGLSSTHGAANLAAGRVGNSREASGSSTNSLAANFTTSSRTEPQSWRPEDVTGPSFGSQRLSPRLEQIDLQLANEIIKPAETWGLERFATELLDIQSRPQSELERTQSLQILAKVDRLRNTQRQLQRAAQERSSSAIRAAEQVGSGLSQNAQWGATFDAFGWLAELVQNNGKSEPAYVLKDDDGKIICQLAPAPGLNLHRYLNTKIGVKGTRGFNQRLKLNHVTAERVVVLENNLR
jgi:hypothetical protein